MTFFTRSYEDIASESMQQLAVNTNITQFSPGAKARFMLDTVHREQANQFLIFDTNLAQAFIDKAEGKFLDFFGDIFDLPRQEATFAEATDNNFMFYVSTGTFGDINTNQDFDIPFATLVSTVPYEGTIVTPGIEDQPVVSYKTTETVTCSSDQSFVYAPVRAVVEGSNSDVPRNVLNQHNFSIYTLSSQNLLKCTNRHAIQTGVDRESDTAYKFRLQNIFRARTEAVWLAIRLAALSVPGVADIFNVLCEQGPGSYSIYVKGLTPTTSPSLIAEVNRAVSLVTGHGIRAYVLAPNYIGIELIAKVSWSPKAKPVDISRGYAAMRDAVEAFLGDLDIGEELVLSDLIDVMLGAAPLALNIGANRPNTFEEVYVYRSNPESTLEPSRSLLLSDKVTPLYNEHIVLETSNRFRGIQF